MTFCMALNIQTLSLFVVQYKNTVFIVVRHIRITEYSTNINEMTGKKKKRRDNFEPRMKKFAICREFLYL